MTQQQLIKQIRRKNSFLCIGLDVDLEKIPKALLKEDDPIFAFNKAIIDHTHHLAVAYKPNLAFYEAYGLQGRMALEKTINYLKKNHPQIYIIADAKRGDIGNTSSRYARAFFDQLQCDALTIAPYMGRDSVEPFLEFEGKTAILLALTSNKGAADFQGKKTGDGSLFEMVLKTSLTWKNSHNLMFVVGATQPEAFKTVRQIVPDHFLLVPGIGAQGGDLEKVCDYGFNKNCGLLVNSSRGIIYASSGEDFAEAAAKKAKELQQTMARIITERL